MEYLRAVLLLESAIPKKNLKGILKGKVKSWKYMLQASENYNNIQEPRKEQNLEDISQ